MLQRLILLSFGLLLTLAASTTHKFNFNVTWVSANPDGVHPRRMIGINGQWPCPTIRVAKGDRVQIHLLNLLGDRNTLLHFHGLFMRGHNAMDGPEMVTQCPLAPGRTIIYDFVVEQLGTYWYHSHSGSQYADGLRGMFIVDETSPGFSLKYDHEVELALSDHYHLESPLIMQSFMSRYNPGGAEPIPQNLLFNNTRNATWLVRPKTTYLLRITNMAIFASQYLYFENHNLTIVEADGVWTEPTTVDSIYLTAGQRYSVLLTTKDLSTENYRIVHVMDETMLDVLPQDLVTVSTNYMVYDREKALPSPETRPFKSVVGLIRPIDDMLLRPLDHGSILPDADYQIVLDFEMTVLGDGVTYAAFNGKTYTPPRVPTLMTALSAGKNATIHDIYGSNTNTFVLQKNEVVEIVLNNMDPGKHPFHLHGHHFQVVYRLPQGPEDAPIKYDPGRLPEYLPVPLVRDTVEVLPNGYVVLRFRSDNPGVWFFHCHVDWHLEQGLAIVLVEDPLELQQQTIPQNHRDVCRALHIPTEGNAVGNRVNWFDLAGEKLQKPPLPTGFTARGYVAMLMCAAAAVYGVLTIYKYGIDDVSSDHAEHTLARLHHILEEHDRKSRPLLEQAE